MNIESARKLLSPYFEAPIARLFVHMGFSAGVLSLLGLLIAGASAVLLGMGQLATGGAVVLLAGVFDTFDGAVARATGKTSAFGALLDSVVDRVSETVVLLGLLVYFLDQNHTLGAVLVYVTLASSVMVSYAKARAEGLGVECKVGVMQRPERVITLSVGLVAGQWWLSALLMVLATIAALASITTVQRMIHVARAQTLKE